MPFLAAYLERFYLQSMHLCRADAFIAPSSTGRGTTQRHWCHVQSLGTFRLDAKRGT